MVLGGYIADRITDLMNDTQLHFGICEYSINRFGESFESIDRCDQDVLDSSVVQIGQNLQPEIGSLAFGEIQAHYLFFTVQSNTEDGVNGFGYIHAVLFDFVIDRIEPYEAIYPFVWTLLVFFESGDDLIGNELIVAVERDMR